MGWGNARAYFCRSVTSRGLRRLGWRGTCARSAAVGRCWLSPLEEELRLSPKTVLTNSLCASATEEDAARFSLPPEAEFVLSELLPVKLRRRPTGGQVKI